MCVSMSVDAGRVFFVSHIMNVLRHGWSWFDDTPLIGHEYRIMNRFIEPLDKRPLPDIDRGFVSCHGGCEHECMHDGCHL